MKRNIFILFMLSFLYSGTFSSGRKKGPYKNTAVEIRECSAMEVIKPHAEYGKFVEMYYTIYNSSKKTYVRGNVTVLKEIENIKVKARSIFWEDNQWRLRLNIPGYGCFRTASQAFFQYTRLKVDFKKCTVAKGTAVFPHMDLNTVQHMFEMEADYGRWLWIFNFTSKGKTVICIALETLVSPTEK